MIEIGSSLSVREVLERVGFRASALPNLQELEWWRQIYTLLAVKGEFPNMAVIVGICVKIKSPL